MSVVDNILDETSKKENIKKLKSSMDSQIKETINSEILQKPAGTVQRVFNNFQKTIDPIGYNNEKGKQFEQEWYEYHDNILKESFLDYKADSIYNKKNDLKEGMVSSSETETISYLKDALKARHTYFEHTLARDKYNNDCRENVEITYNEFKRDEDSYFLKIKNLINGYLKSYNELFEYKNSLAMLKSGKLNELKKIKSKIDTYSQNLFIDSRKNKYENKNYDFYKSMHFYLLIFYYSLFVLYLIFSDFFKEEQYYNRILVFFIVLYLLIPFILPYILHYINYLYIYYLEINNEREEIVSYPDIVNKYHDKIE